MILNKIKRVFNGFILFFVIYLPGGLGRKIRYWYWSKKFKKCGKNVIIDEGVIIQNPEWISVGNNVWIDRYCVLIAGAPDVNTSARVFHIKENKYYKFSRGELVISDNVHIGPFCTIQAHGGVFIGKNAGIASGSRIYSLSYHYRNPTDPHDLFPYKFSPMVPIEEQCLISSPVVISDDCAIGLNSVILPGSVIKKGTWIGVMSHISGETEEDSVYISRKAEFLKRKFEDREIK